MRTLEITIQRTWKGRWPVAAEWNELGSGLVIRRDSVLPITDGDPQALGKTLDGQALGDVLFQGTFRGFRAGAGDGSEPLHILLFVEAETPAGDGSR